MELIQQVFYVSILPIVAITYILTYLRCRVKLTTRMIPPGIIAEHCNKGAMLALKSCCLHSVIIGSASAFILYLVLGIDKKVIILVVSAVLFYGIWIYKARTGCFKSSKVRDIYN